MCIFNVWFSSREKFSVRLLYQQGGVFLFFFHATTNHPASQWKMPISSSTKVTMWNNYFNIFPPNKLFSKFILNVINPSIVPPKKEILTIANFKMRLILSLQRQLEREKKFYNFVLDVRIWIWIIGHLAWPKFSKKG